MEYRIRVKAGEGKESVLLAHDGRLIVSVRAPREEGRANARACELLAEHFMVPVKSVSVVRGHQQSSKIVRISETNTHVS
ncbi:MAG: hypothetical protein A2494_00465 [Candidatus Lloydbacteria bacterium RIFOXYC12_FULL_46_25]|uniref:Uncharacterized protein n=1 Tax=Candidatus Lloydbacteria bacterium RIFOXYC12_FULL_46_25 TaxID=1798670 RepID=A0A1G2DX05_9BACT|nr:MAG: hypothetical protein A2494_00465 [Candidatus Lloydbacteria bacterium RIFOXYC12_FULL_46_25]